jgi:hypothetical protein
MQPAQLVLPFLTEVFQDDGRRNQIMAAAKKTATKKTAKKKTKKKAKK